MDKNDGSASALAATTSSTTTAAAAVDNKNINHENNEDPYLWLEDIESTESLDFAKACNEQCLKILGNPETKSSYARILSVLESEDRIPGVTQYGILEKNQERILVNFWKDAEHPKGIWRQTSLESYRTKDPSWHILLDLDQLAEQDQMGWVWKGATPLPRGRDSSSSNMNRVTRALLQLSNGGSDAIHIREFDLFDGAFVVPDDQAFHINVEGKTRISYKSRNITYVGSSVFGSDAVTDSGYPRTVHEWVRGTPLEQAPKIWEGETADVSVGMYIVDERTWNGGIYEVRYRSITFYKTLYWMRKISAEQLEIPNQQQGNDVSSLDFTKVDIPEDASISFLGKMFIISLRSDWSPDASSDNDDESASKTTYKQGSVIITQIDHFLKHGAANSTYTILFEPTERTAYEYFTASKNYLVLSIMDNVKSKLQFFKIDPDGDRLEPIGYVPEPQIRDCSIRPVDAYSGLDDFWFETSDFVTPSSLFLVDANKILELPHDDESSPSAPDYITRGEQPLKSLPEQYNADNLVVEQRMATSKDGTKIPYFIIYQKDIILDGSNPTLLYAYGGFEVSQTPHYIASAGLAWLERGGVYIEANIRGGGEFGPAWHQSALREKRHKCYEDFAAVAEHLIASNICSPQTLAGRGGSNGGLLMGYMYTKYPHLFGAIHCAVPLLYVKICICYIAFLF
jgi:prolyl oligopeptidase